ncbi:sensor histidine kinase [Streptomyces sp. NPDC059999]|uniref:sensor histidine kinase n=1 Tax=Streptomyces sp. NPDC059999 TaxID=3347030 RepID=UPI0036ADCB1E
MTATDPTRPARGRRALERGRNGGRKGADASHVTGTDKATVTTRGTPQGATQGTPEGATQGASQGATQGTAQGATQGTAQGAAKGARSRRSPARTRLRRLQFRLTLAYTLVTLAGVSVLSWMVIRTDERSWHAAEYDEMGRRAAVSTSLIYYTDAGIQLDGLYDDEATQGRPQVTVLRRAPGGTLKRIFTSQGQAEPVAEARLTALARSAMERDDTVRAEVSDAHGDPAYLLGRPFHHDESGAVEGAVVVVGDPAHRVAEHGRLIVSVLTGAGLLTCLAAVTGHLLSGRSLRPAWQALEAQERMLADTAHELRTPVAVMRSSVDVAGTDPRGLGPHLPRIRRATERLTDVVDNVLTRGRLQGAADTLRPVPLRLDQLVEQVCEELTAGPHTLTASLEPSVATADPALVRIAVRNLLDNALRHGRTPGDPEGRAQVHVTVRGPVVAVSDRGPGVAAANLPVLAARFRSPGGGSGIGLSLVAEVATAHGGALTADTRPGGGSVFRLVLGPREARRARGRSTVPGNGPVS